MRNLLKLSDYKINLFVFILCFVIYFVFEASYSVDSLRYAYAGMQLVEKIFPNILEPNISSKLSVTATFHENIDYSFPRREFFTIIPNLIFYCLSILFKDSLDYLIIINLIIYSLIFNYCTKFYKFNDNVKYFLFLSFLFFGHYQITGWNIKILPEIMYFCTLIFFLIKLLNYKKTNIGDLLVLFFLSLSCFLIRPQGLVFFLITLLIIFAKKIFLFNINKYILYLFIYNLFFIPFLLFLDLNDFYNVPIISIKNTGLSDGAIISGWINYYNGKLIFQEVRFLDKQFDFGQSYNYFDLLKITSYRLFYFINPYKYYLSIYANLWNMIYFSIIYIVAIKFFFESSDNLKKNLSIFLITSILSFHLFFPVTGAFRYQLSLIAIIFVLNFEYLYIRLKKDE